jgi:hypothetical protein
LRRLGSLAAIAAVASAGAAPLAAPAQAAVFAPLFYSNAKPLTKTPVSVTLWGELKLNSTAVGEIACNAVLTASVWNEASRPAGAVQSLTSPRCKAPVLETQYENVCRFTGCPPTVLVSGELPLEVEVREAEVCSEEVKTELSECPAKAERRMESLPLRIRRRTVSFPWSLRVQEHEDEGGVVREAILGIPPASQSCYPTEIVEGVQRFVQWEKVPPGCIKLDVMVPQAPVELVFYGSLVPWWINGAGNGLDASHLEFRREAGELVSSTEGVRATWSTGSLKSTGSESRELIVVN